MRLAVHSLFGLALLAGACRLTSDAGIVGVYTPGAAGRLEFRMTEFAGGHLSTGRVVVDSAHATIETRSCSQPVTSSSFCDLDANRQLRSIARAEIDSMFRIVTSAPFRAVRAVYENVSGIIPPDAASVQLDVTVNERTRTITWERNSSPPRILTDLQCLVLSSGGSLALCAPVS